MLAYNEVKVCDAIVRHLEARENTQRHGLFSPEAEGHTSPVEIAVWIGRQLFVLEHTGIEPFSGHMKTAAQARVLFEPIVLALEGALEPCPVFERAHR